MKKNEVSEIPSFEEVVKPYIRYMADWILELEKDGTLAKLYDEVERRGEDGKRYTIYDYIKENEKG